jgi:hypothetical protein
VQTIHFRKVIGKLFYSNGLYQYSERYSFFLIPVYGLERNYYATRIRSQAAGFGLRGLDKLATRAVSRDLRLPHAYDNLAAFEGSNRGVEVDAMATGDCFFRFAR